MLTMPCRLPSLQGEMKLQEFLDQLLGRIDGAQYVGICDRDANVLAHSTNGGDSGEVAYMASTFAVSCRLPYSPISHLLLGLDARV